MNISYFLYLQIECYPPCIRCMVIYKSSYRPTRVRCFYCVLSVVFLFYFPQIESLRDCIRRECEERYELTEALSNARTELLSLQRFQPSPPVVSADRQNHQYSKSIHHQNDDNIRRSSSSSLVPMPPSQGRQHSPASLTPTKMSGETSQSEESWNRWKISKKTKSSSKKSLPSTSSNNVPSANDSHASFKHKLNLSLKNS